MGLHERLGLLQLPLNLYHFIYLFKMLLFVAIQLRRLQAHRLGECLVQLLYFLVGILHFDGESLHILRKLVSLSRLGFQLALRCLHLRHQG